VARLGPGGFGDPPPLYVDAVQNLYLDNPLDPGGLRDDRIDRIDEDTSPENSSGGMRRVAGAV